MFYEESLSAMGGQFHYKVLLKNGMNAKLAQRCIRQAHKEVLHIENTYSEFREDSLLTSINKAAGKRAINIAPFQYLLFKEAISFGEKTQGHFDITFRTQNPNLSYRDIRLDENSIFLPHPDLKISLGGIGKGYAVDQAYFRLRKLGVENFIVNGNGDIRVHSATYTIRPWHIAIKNPLSLEKVIGQIPLKKGAVASSGNYIQKAHIKTQIADLLGITVISPSATEADVYGTALFSMGREKAHKFCEKNGIHAILIDNGGVIHHTIQPEKMHVLQNSHTSHT